MKQYILIFTIFLGCVSLHAKDLLTAGLLPLQTIGVPDSESEMVEDLLNRTLAQTKLYTLIDRGKVAEALRTLKLSSQTCNEPTQVAQVGKRLEADIVFYGQLMKAGSSCFLHISKLDRKTGESQTVKRKFTAPEPVDPLIKEILFELTGSSVLATSTPSAPLSEKTGKIYDILRKRTKFLDWEEWETAPVMEDIRFSYKNKIRNGHLSIANDEDNLYILLVVHNEDFYQDFLHTDRLFIILDENCDAQFTDNSEDRLGLLTCDARRSGDSLSLSDWYYHNKDREWELNRGGSQKKAVFFCTGSCKDGEIQDVAYELLIPIASHYKDDLQSGPGDKVGIAVKYGNVTDNYANYPPDILFPDSSPDGFLEYLLRR